MCVYFWCVGVCVENLLVGIGSCGVDVGWNYQVWLWLLLVVVVVVVVNYMRPHEIEGCSMLRLIRAAM